ncbi:MAG: protein-L-isoaspartate carboxylmethyltransferase [Microbacterium sp.]|nr:MAG: protein-L-isoaspartate carboxylmethyltransferase [Microbacterium sp.]
MPYRDQATVRAWVEEFSERETLTTDVTVLEKEFTAGPESGMVVVSLRTASTVTYIQPVMEEGLPHWVVTFEARPDSFDLDSAGVAALAHDLGTLARLLEFLQLKTDAILAAAR